MHLKLITILFGTLLLGACAGGSPFATSYGREGLIDTGGYKEKEVEPRVWRVQGRSNALVRRGFAYDIAFYRAAELMNEQGFLRFQVLDVKGSSQLVSVGGSSRSYAGETVRVWVVGLSETEGPMPCRADRKEVCEELDTASTLEKLGPGLGVSQD